MKKLGTFAATLAILAGSCSLAIAQHREDQGRPQGQPMEDHHGEDHRDGDHSDWRRGGRIGHDDWERGRHIDYRERHLRQPPRGYEWREIDGRYVLAVIATGVIADIILNAR